MIFDTLQGDHTNKVVHDPVAFPPAVRYRGIRQLGPPRLNPDLQVTNTDLGVLPLFARLQ